MHDQRPGEHLRVRRLFAPAFSAGRTAARRSRIQQLTDERIDAALSRGSLDVVGDLGRPVALTIAAELLGLPPAVHAFCGACARDLIYRVDVLATTPARRERGTLAMIGLTGRLRELLLDARAKAGAPGEAEGGAGGEADADDGLLWVLERLAAVES
jgi:cytochrome P450